MPTAGDLKARIQTNIKFPTDVTAFWKEESKDPFFSSLEVNDFSGIKENRARLKARNELRGVQDDAKLTAKTKSVKARAKAKSANAVSLYAAPVADAVPAKTDHSHEARSPVADAVPAVDAIEVIFGVIIANAGQVGDHLPQSSLEQITNLNRILQANPSFAENPRLVLAIAVMCRSNDFATMNLAYRMLKQIKRRSIESLSNPIVNTVLENQPEG